MCQAVPGAKAAFDKIRAMGRDDMLLIAGVPQEDPAVITAAADFVLYTDEPKQGDTIMETCAKEWGVDVFVHYSLPAPPRDGAIAARKALLGGERRGAGHSSTSGDRLTRPATPTLRARSSSSPKTCRLS